MRKILLLTLCCVAVLTAFFAIPVAIASGPNPQFTFSTDEPGATYTCQLDNGTPTACTSPQGYSNLAAGKHSIQLTVTFTVAAAGPTTYYVDNVAGSDSNPGTQAAPFATLAKAQSAAQSGDQIALLRGDTWTGGLDLKQSNVSVYGYGSAAARPIITGGLNGDCIKMEGGGDRADNLELDNCGYAGVEIFGANDSVVNAKIAGHPGTTTPNTSAGVRTAAGSTGATITGDKFVNVDYLNQNTSSGSSGAFSVLLNGDGATVSHDTMTGSETPSQAYGWDGSAVEVFNGNNNTVDHNVGTNNDAFAELGGTSNGNTYAYNSETNDGTVDTQATGFVLPGSATNTTVQHDTVYLVGGTTQAFVCYSSCASSTKVQDDIFKATKQAVWMDGSGWTESGNVVNGPHNITLATSDSTADAALANPPADVSLTSSSPAIDRGTTQPYPTDLAGNPSLVGAATDSGAYEFQAAQQPDTTPPSTPTGAAVSNPTQTSLTLSWSASTDNVGVTGYDVFDGSTSDGTTSGTSHTFTGLMCGTTYTLGVDAFDAAGNKSGLDTASGTTSACSVADTTPPSTPTGLTVSGQTQTGLTLSWTASDDNGGGDNVTGYNTTLNGSSAGNVTGLTKTFSGLTCGTTYTLGVQAVDQAGNVSTAATTSGTTSACTTSGSYQHIVWVVMENHSYAQIHGSSSAPYINSLMSQYGNLTNIHAESHPSAPNYVDMTSGGNGSCCTDDGYHNLNVPSIFSQLGTGARSLEESMPSPCDTGNSGNYAIRHNPEPYYLANIGQALCNGQDVALGATPDLSAKFTFITPNLCHDMHSNSCSGSSDVIKQGDDFLKGFVPQLLNSPQYQAGNTAIFVTWDENEGSSGNQIPTIVINPSVSGGGQACSSTNFDHYSMLQYVEDTFGQAHLGGAAGATTMKGCDGL